MNTVQNKSNFYFYMGITLLALVIAGFSAVMATLNRSPLELPLLFHVHGVTYVLWFLLFIMQAKLISRHNYSLHRTLGYSSIIVFLAMLTTAFLMTSHSYDRGTSPIPDMSLEQFLMFPLMDIVGLVIFYLLAVFNTDKPQFHKHSMLVCSIAIMDPALARLGLVIGMPPLSLLLHIGLIALVMSHDWRINKHIHFVTWMGLAYIILRAILIFTVGATEEWAAIVQGIFD